MRNHILPLSLCSLLLLGSGCFAAPPVVTLESRVDALNVSMNVFEELRPVDGAGGCAVFASYPVIEQTPGLREEMRSAMNQNIETQAALYFDAAPHKNAKESAGAFLTSCALGVADVVKVDPTSFVVREEWNSNLSGEVLKNGGGILSLELTNTSYMGGAHPGTSSLLLMFDIGTGNRLALSDVLTSDEELEVAMSLGSTLVAEYADAVFQEQLSEYEAFLENPSKESAQAIMEKYGEYALAEGGVLAHFDEYEIAPYAAGPIDITITR